MLKFQKSIKLELCCIVIKDILLVSNIHQIWFNYSENCWNYSTFDMLNFTVSVHSY